MKPRFRYLLACLVAGAAIVAGCGDSASEDDDRATTTSDAAGPVEEKAEPEPEAEPEPGTKLALGPSHVGSVLVDSVDQAIYLFDVEDTSKPECYGACARAWPPVYANGRPEVAESLDRELLDVTRRNDGRKQLTYGGHPLYYYAHEGPGEVLCHNVVEFGGTWLAVTSAGEAAPTT